MVSSLSMLTVLDCGFKYKISPGRNISIVFDTRYSTMFTREKIETISIAFHGYATLLLYFLITMSFSTYLQPIILQDDIPCANTIT